MIKNQSDVKERSYAFSLEIIKLLRPLPNDYVSRIILGQLLRSGTSIGANVMEAQAGSSKKDFANYLNIALKSANESKYWLNLMKDSGIGHKESLDILLEEVKQIANILGSSLITLKKQETKLN
jgi:four helix bundle protein